MSCSETFWLLCVVSCVVCCTMVFDCCCAVMNVVFFYVLYLVYCMLYDVHVACRLCGMYRVCVECVV